MGKRIQHELGRNKELQSIVAEVSRNINQAISEDDYERLQNEYKTQYSVDLALNQYYNELEQQLIPELDGIIAKRSQQKLFLDQFYASAHGVVQQSERG